MKVLDACVRAAGIFIKQNQAVCSQITSLSLMLAPFEVWTRC